MKFKKLIAASLLIILSIPVTFSQEKKNYKKIVQDEFSIDLKKNYNAETVIEIIAICLEEKDKAIEEAYNEGYKIGTMEFLPELEAEKKRNELLQQNYDILKSINKNAGKEKLTIGLNSFSGGLLVGFISGGLVGIRISSTDH